MDTEEFLRAIRDSLHAIQHPHFYNTERGFQGELLAELRARRPAFQAEEFMLVEQEHQKTLANHNIKLRPDIIVHQPFDPAIHISRQQGNFAVIALKRGAGPKKATEDFMDLQRLMSALHYPLRIFININHSRTQVLHAPALEESQTLVVFATRLHEGGVNLAEDRA